MKAIGSWVWSVVVVLAVAALCVGSAAGANDFYWDGGGGADTSWDNPLNWENDSTVPTTSDDNAWFAGNGHANNVSATITNATIARMVLIAQGANAATVTLANASASLRTAGHNLYCGFNSTSRGHFVHSNGTVIVDGNFSMGNHGSYTLHDGLLAVTNTGVTFAGQFTMHDGTFECNSFSLNGGAGYPAAVITLNGGLLRPGTSHGVAIGIAYDNAGGTSIVNQTGGEFRSESTTYMGYRGAGIYRLDGGVYKQTQGRMHLGVDGGSATFELNCGDPNNTGIYTNAGGGYDIKLNNSGDSTATIRGHGMFHSANDNLYQSGRVIADGVGQDNTLDMTGFANIYNTTDNTTNNGWFAQNGGKLALPKITVANGSSTNNWGEATDDTTIDLVNSVRMEFDAVTGGGLDVALLAHDRTDVVVSDPTVIGLWVFEPSAVAGFAFGGGSVTLTFRYVGG